jgi:ABC-type sugar transport system permease subunit
MLLKRKRSRELLLIYLFLLPALAVFLIYRIIPLGWNLFLSFQEWKAIGPNSWIGLSNYAKMFKDDVFWKSLANTMIYFAVGSPIAIILAIFIAIFVNQPLRGRNIYRALIFIPYPITPIAVGIIWQWLYNERFGLINYLLRSIGIVDQGIPFLQSFQWALPAVILTSIWQVVGFFFILVLTGLQSIPSELYEAAIIDGASSRNRFFRITLPLIRSTIFICFIVGIINSFTLFDLIYVMTGGGPGHSTEILITYIYMNAFSFGKMGYAASITVILFLFLLIITYGMNRVSGGEAGGMEIYE